MRPPRRCRQERREQTEEHSEESEGEDERDPVVDDLHRAAERPQENLDRGDHRTKVREEELERRLHREDHLRARWSVLGRVRQPEECQPPSRSRHPHSRREGREARREDEDIERVLERQSSDLIHPHEERTDLRMLECHSETPRREPTSRRETRIREIHPTQIPQRERKAPEGAKERTEKARDCTEGSRPQSESHTPVPRTRNEGVP